MKKLAVILCACSLLTIGCKNSKETTEEVIDMTEVEEQVDPEVEKCKAQCEAWQNWDQQSDEQKAELISARKAKIEEHEAMKAECEAKRAEFEAQKAEFEKTWAENWAKFDEMSVDDQKALIDNYMKFNCPKHGCKEGEGPKCCKGGENAPQCGQCCKGGECGKCCKEGQCGKCCKKGEGQKCCKGGEGEHKCGHEKANCPQAK